MSKGWATPPVPKNNRSVVDGNAELKRLHEALDVNRLPKHIAVIMDGNGRWATGRSLPRIEGHRAGVKALRATVEACAELQIDYLTVYAFSTENWERPRDEVGFLMNLLVDVLKRELPLLKKNRVRLEIIGDRSRLPHQVNANIDNALRQTEGNDGLTMCVALNYGGRAEIMRAATSLAQDMRAGRIQPENIDEETFASYLYTAHIPDPDLIIRTGGEHRISNFLLWQAAYAELFITPVFWPDFQKHHLYEAIIDYQRRQRRFGRL